MLMDAYVPRNAPIKVPSRTVALGQVDSRDELTAATLEDKTAGDSSGEQSDMGGTTNGSNTNSTRVDAALLAVESQHMRYDRALRRSLFVVDRSWSAVVPLVAQWSWRWVVVVIGCVGSCG